MKRTLAILVLLLALVCLQMGAAANEPPLLLGRVTPVEGGADTEFVFVVTYTDRENEAPASIQIYIDGTAHDLEPMDATDTNYSNGKDYVYRTTLGEGVSTYYFKASDGHNASSSKAGTVQVVDDGFFETEHGDLIRAMFFLTPVFVVLFVVALVPLYRMSRALKRMENDKGNGNGADGEDEKDSEDEGCKPGEYPGGEK